MTCTFSINSTLYGCAVSINDTVYVLSQDSNTDSIDNLCNGTYNISIYNAYSNSCHGDDVRWTDIVDVSGSKCATPTTAPDVTPTIGKIAM